MKMASNNSDYFKHEDFENNYIITKYALNLCYETKFAHKVKLTLYNDPELTNAYIAYNFVNSDKALMRDYKDTLSLIVVQFSGFFDLSVKST
jgi:hypothetical protein